MEALSGIFGNTATIQQTPSQEAISTSTLNVARASSYQSLVSSEQSFPHQPIIRHQGDRSRVNGDTSRYQGERCRGDNDETNLHRRYDSLGSHGESIKHSGDTLRHPGDSLRREGDYSRCHVVDVQPQDRNREEEEEEEEENRNTLTRRGSCDQLSSEKLATRRYQPNSRSSRDHTDTNRITNSDTETLRRAFSDTSDRMRQGERRVRQGDRQPRPPAENQGRGVRSPDVRRQRYLKQGPVLSPLQTYETTFGTRMPPKRSVS